MLDFEIDNDFVEAYNAENGTEYLPFPQDNEDYVTWIAERENWKEMLIWILLLSLQICKPLKAGSNICWL